MYTFSQLSERVARAIENIAFPQSPEMLYHPMRYALLSGGKHIRPTLLLMCADLFLQKIEEAHLNVSLGVELFHCFTLVHDDIMDRSDLRRGLPTVVSKWGANTAILSGDAMLIEAYKLICSAANSANSNALLHTFNRAATEVCEGQQLDVDFELLSTITEEQYFVMVGKKTAALLAASAAMGAIAANAAATDVQLLYDFAYKLGLAFQLQDDYLDVYSDAAEFGKTTGGDVVAGKKTFLFVGTAAALQGKDRSEFLQLMQNSCLPAAEKIKQAKNFYAKANVVQQLKNKENTLFNAAMQNLTLVSVPQKQKKHLENLALKLLQRKK
ncbi:MAG: polyprenyl synthetase family protein [Prevotellaceae bacterium]|jgi:geranylgeranyl diphosphate synthase type II|nr:polyprenyl synthetase family protein [Prevotellaceae bacterium]